MATNHAATWHGIVDTQMQKPNAFLKFQDVGITLIAERSEYGASVVRDMENSR
jgi:hypothetical protein